MTTEVATDLVPKIIKLLNLTTSPNDHEALSAIRMANNFLKTSNLSWDNLSLQTKQVFSDKHAITIMVNVVSKYKFDLINEEIKRICKKWKEKNSMQGHELEIIMDAYYRVILK